jgi:hypothetical protein
LSFEFTLGRRSRDIESLYARAVCGDHSIEAERADAVQDRVIGILSQLGLVETASQSAPSAG